MQKDLRFEEVATLVENGDITTVREIFLYIPIGIMAEAIRTSEARMLRIIETPHIYPLLLFFRMGSKLAIPDDRIINLVYNQFMQEQSENFEKSFSKLWKKRNHRLKKVQQRKKKLPETDQR